MPRQPNEAILLAEKMVRELEAQRGLGGEAYPLTLRQLAGLAESQALPPLIEKASSRKPFTDRTLLARKKDLEAPVALQEDLGALAASPLLLNYVLNGLGPPPYPGWPINKLKSAVTSPLKVPLEQALHQHLRENSLPPSAAHGTFKNKPFVYLRSLPPPPPPRKPEEELAERMLQTLQARRQDPDSYPLSLDRLAQLAGGSVAPALLKKTVATRLFADQVLFAQKKHPEAPLALREDQDQLAASPLLLTFAVQAARTAVLQAFTLEDLKKKIAPELRPSFHQAVLCRLEGERLPPGLGWLPAGKKKLLFQLKDVHGRPVAATLAAPQERAVLSAAPVPPTVDFAPAFGEAFHRLDREAGGHNFVSLVGLRRALPLARADFDRELWKLRAAGRFTLSAAEGRHGLSADDRAAAITEDGTLLLFVSRRG